MALSQYTEAFAAVICLTLMAGMMLTFALGRRAGVNHHRTDPAGARAVSGAVEGAIFGLHLEHADRLQTTIWSHAVDVVLRELLEQMQSTTNFQVPHD